MSKAMRSDVDRFVAHRMKELRQCACITQLQAARQLGVTNQQVHKFETGENRIYAGQLLAVTRLFGVPVADFFNGYDGGAPLASLRNSETSQMLRDLANKFLELEPKHQKLLVRLARAMAADG